MKKLLGCLLIALLLPLALSAQVTKFGYFSYQEVLHTMPAYTSVRHHLDDLSGKYDAEMKRAEDEFNNKYEEFLDGQKEFAPSILEKRQAELRDLMEKNIAFREESKRLLAQAEQDAMAPLKANLAAAVRQIGQQQGLAFVLNTDGDAVPYVDTTLGVDITSALKALLH